MLKKFFFVLFIFQVGVHSIAQTKINDTIGGVILTSHRNHLKHLPFIRFHTIMYFVNIEDKYVLRFDGLEATMDAKLQSISMVDSILQFTYCGFNRKLQKNFTERIVYDLHENKYVLQMNNKKYVHRKIKCKFTPDQAWYMIPE